MQHKFFQYGVAAIITLATIVSQSTSRELRPSDHGLAAYQEDASSPTQNGDAQQMLSFFGSSVPHPEAQNISEDTWWSVHGGDGRSRDHIRRDHVRKGLLVASAVCGMGGVVLLVVSGIVFLVRLRKKQAEAERLSSNSELHAVNDK
ncbi:hypothetical protein Pfo_023537 [Paulownia fortunei]|nr:hypothetical protein Pfo_023537 [Paulownia fortunei]